MPDEEWTFEAGSPEAKRANELARELVNARVFNGGSGVFMEAVSRVVNDSIRDAPDDPHFVVERLAYLILALTQSSHLAIRWAAGYRSEGSNEAFEKAEKEIVKLLAQKLEDFGREGRWF